MNFKSIYITHFKLLNGILFFLALVLLLINYPFTAFRYDSRVYWELTQSFDASGSFSLYNYNEALRGYLFPLFLYPAYKFASFAHCNEIVTCRLYLAVIATLFYTFGTTKLFQSFFKMRLLPLSHAFLGITFLVLWWEYFSLPLSDFIGLVFLLSAFAVSSEKLPVSFFAAGALLYAAINIRLAFMISIPVFFVFCLLAFPEKTTRIKAFLWAVSGFMLLAIPQVLINSYHHKTYTVFVPTSASSETGGANLFLMQLNWGLSIQKYETNIGSIYPQPEVRYIDEKGKQLSNLHGNKDFLSYSEYLQFVLKNPSVVILYVKHFFNGLDITSSMVYLRGNIHDRGLGIRWFNFTCIFVGLLSLIYFIKNDWYKMGGVLLSIFLIALIVTPTALEVRFFMPLHVVLYLYGIRLVQYTIANFKSIRMLTLTILLVCYLCFVSIGMTRSVKMMKNIEFLKTVYMEKDASYLANQNNNTNN